MDYEEQLSAAKFRAERDMARQEVKELREELDAASKDALRSEIVDQCMDNIEREIKLGVNSIAELLEIGGEIQELPIAEVCPRIVAELEKRLMPKGCEWPRYESGEKVELGCQILTSKGGGEVCGIEFNECGICALSTEGVNGDEQVIIDIENGERVKRPSVPAGDGVHIKAGDTIYSDDYKEGLIVDGYQHDGSLIAHMRDGNHVVIRDPRHFTHTKPEPHDTWGLIWTSVTTGTTTLHEFERRCKALAEKENGNE